MWVPRSATADWPADDCIGTSSSTACNATAPARCGSIRGAAIVRPDPAGNSARAWVLRLTIPDRVGGPKHTFPRGRRSMNPRGTTRIARRLGPTETDTSVTAVSSGRRLNLTLATDHEEAHDGRDQRRTRGTLRALAARRRYEECPRQHNRRSVQWCRCGDIRSNP